MENVRLIRPDESRCGEIVEFREEFLRSGSERTIRANGGVYESSEYEPEAKLWLKRFWIRL